MHKIMTLRAKFLSTLPARGATTCLHRRQRQSYYFYPRSPRGERRRLALMARISRIISIHAPREGSDLMELHFKED